MAGKEGGNYPKPDPTPETDSTTVDLSNAPTSIEAVDLGLSSGILWANMNVGADRPKDGGLYFAWGEKKGYTSDTNDGRSFDWASYKWMNEGQSSCSQVTKYQTQMEGNSTCCWFNSDREFIGDGKVTLDLDDDAAHANWGGRWVMPTVEDVRELRDNTTYNITTVNGVKGFMLPAKIMGIPSFFLVQATAVIAPFTIIPSHIIGNDYPHVPDRRPERPTS